ncbi:MAG: hypothetical protein IH868_12065 [Chloroflexi bacterium]|nr:hypothetical protein [Chloroflexota bacterium]
MLGDLESSALRFQSAVDLSRRTETTVPLAWCLADYSEVLLQRDNPGDREKATELQDEAIAIAEELGMKPVLERVLAQREILKA